MAGGARPVEETSTSTVLNTIAALELFPISGISWGTEKRQILEYRRRDRTGNRTTPASGGWPH